MASYQFRGTAFPWNGTLARFIEVKDDHDILLTSILTILMTRRGERVMLRDFGSLLHEKPFEPNDITLANELLLEVRDEVRKWDDRIGIKSVSLGGEDHVLRARVIYFNALDPLQTQQEFEVSLEIGAQDIIVT